MPCTPFDPKAYVHHLDGMDLSETEKIEFVRTLWLIAQSFVDDAYRETPGGGVVPTISQSKAGFTAASMISSRQIKRARATGANDNAAPQGSAGSGRQTNLKQGA